MPRWADEGASLLSEDLARAARVTIKSPTTSWRGAAELPLSRLFVIEEYPKDLMSFYGQGYSISRFLIEMGGRPRFLRFVRDGLKSGWDPPPAPTTSSRTSASSTALARLAPRRTSDAARLDSRRSPGLRRAGSMIS